MNPFALEHGRAACAADIAIYAAAVAILAGVLIGADAKAPRIELAALALAGLAGWTLVEYAMHRFVLHGIEPFRRWHALHHERPRALIGTPTILSALIFVVLAFLPALVLAGPWRAGALTLGLVAGYLAYTVMHHATHHWSGRIAWLNRRKRWHALHHHGARPACFGVTTGFWDRAFGTAGGARR
jgi:cyclopropane-fatty-acyl-phospholipid synthase